MIRRIWRKIRKAVCISFAAITGGGVGFFGTLGILTVNPIMGLAGVGCAALWYLNYQWAVRIDSESLIELYAARVVKYNPFIETHSFAV